MGENRRTRGKQRILQTCARPAEDQRPLPAVLDRRWEDSLASSDDICEGWATHFAHFTTPLENKNFDNELKELLEDINHILNICKDSELGIVPASEEEVQLALKKLKSNKAADCLDITSERLTHGETPVIRYLTDMINSIFECKHVTSILKEGIVTPIFKKGDVTTHPTTAR